VLDPHQLFRTEAERSTSDRPVLVEALDGFVDAGGAKRLTREHLLGTLESELLVRFDVDQLLDYRSRRPLMLFEGDHWDSYDDPVLAIYEVRDADGTPFLLLAGPEPDTQWERFVDAVQIVTRRLDVRLSIGLNAIPMAVPHTRPVGVIAHGSRKELVVGHEPWVGSVHVPASVGHLLEYRLGQAGRDAMGFAVHVPHYVAQSDFPAAAATLVQSVAGAARLVLPTEALLEQARDVRTAIDAEVAKSTEVADVVRALEGQYDAFVAQRRENLPAEGSAGLPSADELGAELERFLAQQSRPGEGGQGS
jgi:hypothetical protein